MFVKQSLVCLFYNFHKPIFLKMNLDHLLPPTPKPPKDLVYSYIDGNGNTYYITKNLIQYDPMTPQYSSSGVYDGGKAAKVVLNPRQFDALKILIQEVKGKHLDHILNRVKGSGQVRLHQDKEHFILAYNTNAQKDLETLLKKTIRI